MGSDDTSDEELTDSPPGPPDDSTGAPDDSAGTPDDSAGAPDDSRRTTADDPSDGSGGNAPTGRDPPGSGADRFEFGSYYELLGVSEEAPTEEIERAYRERAKRHHPDASDRPEQVAERRFQQLLTAREVLTSPERRQAYDELGHEEYRRQSESLGEPVRRAGTDQSAGTEEPEPRPEPGGTVGQPGQVQRSARGEAHRRGDPLVTDAGEAFGGATRRSGGEDADGESDADERGQASGRGIYRLVFEDGVESRSLQYVAGRWARSWRNRVVVGVGSVLLVAGLLAGLPAALDAAGVDVPAPDVTAGRLYLVALAATVAHTGYSCGASEARLPRGQFLADRDHGRFSTATSRVYLRRGAVALAVAFVLASASARNGVDPWAHVADALRGDLSGPVPWFDAPDAGWTGAVDALLSGAFALAAVVGTLLLALGVSIALWRGRYERGLRVRPSLREPVLVVALVSVPVALAAGPVALVSVDALSGLPEAVALAAGVDGTTVTPATVATLGIVLSVVSALRYRARVALAGSGERGQHADESESG
jgi:curved DNA-binding protein CbpA